jgi:hypothetical protein
MAAGIGLVVKIAADTKKAVGDIHDVNQALDGTGTSTSKASKMFGAMKGPALAALAGVATGALAAAGAMVEFGKAAWEDHQEAQKLARVLQTIPGITQDMVDANEAWITQTMFATHVLDTDLREAVGSLALVTGDLTTAQQYASRSADLATVANVEYSTAVEAVQKALSGKTRQLMALAPWLDTNKDGTLSAAEAQGILTAKTLDGMAAAAAAEDPWTTITLIFDEIKESLGQWIIPLFTKLGDWFKQPQNQQKIQEFIDKLGAMSYELGTKLLPKLDQFLDWVGSPEGKKQMKEWANTAQTIANAIIDISEAIAGLIQKWNSLPAPLKGVLGSGLKVKEGGWLDNVLHTAPAPPAAAAGGYAVSGGSGVTVNFYGGIHTDPEATARAITSSLRASDMRNARFRPLTTQLEPAW